MVVVKEPVCRQFLNCLEEVEVNERAGNGICKMLLLPLESSCSTNSIGGEQSEEKRCTVSE